MKKCFYVKYLLMRNYVVYDTSCNSWGNYATAEEADKAISRFDGVRIYLPAEIFNIDGLFLVKRTENCIALPEYNEPVEFSSVEDAEKYIDDSMHLYHEKGFPNLPYIQPADMEFPMSDAKETKEMQDEQFRIMLQENITLKEQNRELMNRVAYIQGKFDAMKFLVNYNA